MMVIDTSALLILIYGLIDPESISKKSRTSMYDKEDYLRIIGILRNDFSKLVILPNVWTETSNLVHNRSYLNDPVFAYFHELANKSQEKYLPTAEVVDFDFFRNLGLTDAAILMCAKKKKKSCLISADSMLINYAHALGIKCYDLVYEMNQRRLMK